MLRRWGHMLGLVKRREQESKCSKELVLANTKLALSLQLKDATIRIVHAGGREELYKHPIPASYLTEMYPGMLVARPDVFKRPFESVLSAETFLLPGKKYYLVPVTTVQKLKRRHSRKGKVEQPDGREQSILAIKDVLDVSAECSDESFCSAKDFFVSNDKWSDCSLRRNWKEKIQKKPFVPPIQKPRTWKDLEWEPSLSSIMEVSP